MAAPQMADECEEELCVFLLEQSRALEKREMSQMRQNAILQRKLEDAERQLRELKQATEHRQRSRQAASVQRRDDKRAKAAARRQEQESTENVVAAAAAAEATALQADLQTRLTQLAERQAQKDKDVKGARAKRKQLDSDLAFWRSCGQEMLEPSAEAPMDAEAAQADNDTIALREVEENTAQLGERSAELLANNRTLEASCEALQGRLDEFNRMARSAQLDEEQLRVRNGDLEAATERARAAEREARDTLATERCREQGIRAEADRFRARLAETLQARESGGEGVAAGPPAAGGAVAVDREDLAYLRRKVKEREEEITAARTENARLQGALRRHADIEGGYRSADRGGGNDVVESNCCGPFDETVSWIVTILFKSILVRRFFCVHLAVLYSWLLFLLWFMSQ